MSDTTTNTEQDTPFGPMRLERRDDGWLLCADVMVADRPGEMAAISRIMADHRANIEHFDFNRSDNPWRVAMRMHCPGGGALGAMIEVLAAQGRLAPPPDATAQSEPGIVDPGSLLKLAVTLEDRPGALAAFSELLAEHQANVIHMRYDSFEAPSLARVSLATPTVDELRALLDALNGGDWHYHVEWQGDRGDPIDAMVGLNMVEMFLLKLKTLLPQDKLDQVGEMFRTSDDMRQALSDFRREAGVSDESMAASEALTRILHLAATSMGRTGPRFLLGLEGPLRLSPEVELYKLACPTGANGYLLAHDGEYTMVDSGYGLYFEDVMAWLEAHHMPPGRIRRAMFTHADADHSGWAGPLAEAYGTAVHMHPDCVDVFRHCNRAVGGQRLQALNRAFTRMISTLTGLRTPREIRGFELAEERGGLGGFPVMGTMAVADLEFTVLESLGGHASGQIFFFERERGLLFCGDYLIDVASLSERDKAILSIPKYLVTSTNKDSAVFSREMALLKDLVMDADRRLARSGGSAWVFSGHGDMYTPAEAGWR